MKRSIISIFVNALFALAGVALAALSIEVATAASDYVYTAFGLGFATLCGYGVQDEIRLQLYMEKY